MGTALTLILVACAALIVWAFITGRVSAVRRRTYLPPKQPGPSDPNAPGDGQGGSSGSSQPPVPD